MYSKRPSFIVGFHGCDLVVRNSIVTQQAAMRPSKNEYDWLGSGFYFWDNCLERAQQWARESRHISEPAVLGAYIDLGNCLDLLDTYHLKRLGESYKEVKKLFSLQGLELPRNNNARLKRALDCAVINHHAVKHEFDSVRGVFWEGSSLYPGTDIQEKNHIQICVRNIDCIKGFFIPRELTQ